MKERIKKGWMIPVLRLYPNLTPLSRLRGRGWGWEA